MRRAVIHPHRYREILPSSDDWLLPLTWTVDGLRALGWEVTKHPDLAADVEVPVYDGRGLDLALFTHGTRADPYVLDVLKRHPAAGTWFLKATIPHRHSAALDPLGYGPYSTLAYDRPAFERLDPIRVESFFERRVAAYIESRETKWGCGVLEEQVGSLPERFVLVLAQTIADETVSRMAWGHYPMALAQIIAKAAEVSPLPIVVKLHPWTDGWPETGSTDLSDKLKAELEALHPNVQVYAGKTSTHAFLPRAEAVITCNSGAGFEALMHRKPIIAWGCPEYRWVAYDLRHLCDLGRALTLDWWDPWAGQVFLAWYVEEYAFHDQPSAQRRVARMMRDVHSAPRR